MSIFLSVAVFLNLFSRSIGEDTPEKMEPNQIQPSVQLKKESEMLFGGEDPKFQCQKDLLYTWTHRHQTWARKLMDSFGKPEPVIHLGNRVWFGDYDSCLGVRAPPHHLSPNGFQGRYAWLYWVYQGEFAENGQRFSLGGCVPDSCSWMEIVMSYEQLLTMINADYPGARGVMKNMELAGAQVVNPTEPFPKSAFYFWLTIGSIFFLVLLGTLLHWKFGSGSIEKHPEDKLPLSTYGRSERNKSAWLSFFSSFSLVENFSALMSTASSPGEITCVHGMRFFTMTWVVMEHMFINSITVTGDVYSFIYSMDQLISQVIVEGQYNVDTFFLLSGFMHAYVTLKSKVVMTGSKWILVNLHRILRISPTFFLLVFFCSTVLPYVSDGPYWININYVTGACEKYWWTHLLYISNLVNPADKCIPWAWYLPNDMQFFFIGTILLLVIKRFPRHGLAVLWAVQISLTIITFVITYEGGFERTMAYIKEIQVNPNSAQKHIESLSQVLYSKPYSRAGPYLMGIVYGYIYNNNLHRRIKISKARSTVYWLLATFGALFAIFGIHLLPKTPFNYGIYHCATRSIWGAAVGWVVYACATGNGGPVNAFLSWKVFVPLSRLSYCTYLCHPVFVYWLYYGLRSPVRYRFLLFYILDLGILLLSVIVALVVHLTIESPFANLEKKLFKRGS